MKWLMPFYFAFKADAIGPYWYIVCSEKEQIICNIKKYAH